MAKRIIIPARYASVRFPGKVLEKIEDQTILAHVYQKAIACDFDSVLIATDDERIAKEAKRIGADYCMTRSDHLSGTDRAREAFEKFGYDKNDIIIGLQGDEPLIAVENIQALADAMEQHQDADMATLAEPCSDLATIMDPNRVKVVMDYQGYALYFSRAPIAWAKSAFPAKMPQGHQAHIHVGIYAYRGCFLEQIAKLEPSVIEHCEGLEQLRTLYHGYKIHVSLVVKSGAAQGVDTQEDLDKVRAAFKS